MNYVIIFFLLDHSSIFHNLCDCDLRKQIWPIGNQINTSRCSDYYLTFMWQEQFGYLNPAKVDRQPHQGLINED